MQGSIDGGGEHFEGYFLCNENGEVYDISTDASQHKFLMADDSYAPGFAEYDGKTVAAAMQDDNPVYEQIAGLGGTMNFSVLNANLQDVSKMVMSGNLPLPQPPYSDKIQWVPCGGNVDKWYVLFNGKVIAPSAGYLQGCKAGTSTVKNNAINDNLNWYNFKDTLSYSRPINMILLNGRPVTQDDVINPDDIPGTTTSEIANNPVVTETSL